MLRLARLLRFAAVFSLLICCTSCDNYPLTAINDFFMESDRIYNPDLIGHWISTDADRQTYLEVEETKPDIPASGPNEKETVHWYKVTISSEGRQSVWTANLFTLADSQFLDVRPFDMKGPFTILREYDDYAIRLHGLYRVKFENDEIHLAEALENAAREQSKTSILEQPTEELQRLVKSMGLSGGAYAAERKFSRLNSRQHFTRLIALGNLGVCEQLTERRHWDEALPFCMQAVAAEPQESSAHQIYAMALAGAGKGVEARTQLKLGFDLCREMPKTGFWSQDCKADSKSVESYQRRVDSTEHMLMAMSSFADREWADAAQHFAQINDEDNELELRFAWALSLKALGKQTEAVEVLRRQPKAPDPNAEKPSKEDLIRPLIVEYLQGKLDDASLESNWDKNTMGSGLNYYVASMRYARGDWKGASEIFKTMNTSETVSDWTDFLATVRLRQIEADQHKPALKKTSKRLSH